MLGDVVRSKLRECLLDMALRSSGTHHGLTRGDRIGTFTDLCPVSPGFFAGLGQRHRRKTTQSHFTLPARQGHAQNPASAPPPDAVI